MNPTLRSKLKTTGATGASALAIALVLGAWFEGTGPTRKMPDGSTQYQAYLDPVGIWTVCHGVTGPGVVARQWYTQQQCDALESAAYKKAEEGAKRLFIHFNTYNRWMQAALIDMVYNLGEQKLTGKTIQRKLNAGDVVGGCDEMDKWVNGRVDGRLVPMGGLVDRRTTTEELCLHWKD